MRADIKGDEVRPGWTMWSLNGVAALMPTPPSNWPTQLREAYDQRVEANLTGSCACGAVADVTGVAPRQARGVLRHEADCPAGDERFAELARSLGATGR